MRGARRIAVAIAVLGLGAAWACGGSSGTRIPDPDSGAPSGTSGTSGTSGLPEPEDAGVIVEPEVDAGPDVEPAGEIEIAFTVDALTQSCMPIVAQDPVTMQGTITIDNKSNVGLGALKFTKGTFLGTGGQVIATFTTDTSIPATPAGGNRVALVEKTSKSMAPAAGCSTVACNREIIVELAFAGGRVGTVRAKPVEMSCSF